MSMCIWFCIGYEPCLELLVIICFVLISKKKIDYNENIIAFGIKAVWLRVSAQIIRCGEFTAVINKDIWYDQKSTKSKAIS